VPMQTFSPATLALDTSAIPISVFVGAPTNLSPHQDRAYLARTSAWVVGYSYLASCEPQDRTATMDQIASNGQTLVWMSPFVCGNSKGHANTSGIKVGAVTFIGHFEICLTLPVRSLPFPNTCQKPNDSPQRWH